MTTSQTTATPAAKPDPFPLPTRRLRWAGIALFTVIHLVGIIGTPIYAMTYGISLPEWILFITYTSLSGMAITMGYHRLFAHATFKTGPVIKFLLLFFGASTFEESAVKWSAQHRQHHQFTDTDRDPYSIQKGFWYAHMGWIIFWKHRVNYDSVKDLTQDPLTNHQYEHHTWWCVGSGIVVPLLIGALTGHLLGAFILSVCLRLVIVMNSAFFINSFAHTFGSRPFDNTISARDHWLGAILTNGEGYHNFHHRFPSDYRNGVEWHHWDPSKWLIYGLSKVGLTWDLRRADAERIRHARAVTAASSNNSK